MKESRRSLFWLVAIVVVLIVANNSLFIVNQTEQALVLRFGKAVKLVKDPGLSFKMPFIENVEMYDKRLLVFNADEKEVIAADQKRLRVDAFVRYRITNPLIFKQTVGSISVMNDRLNRILESVLRQALGDVPLRSIISTERAKIMRRVRDMVNLQASGKTLEAEANAAQTAAPKSGFGIEVVDVRIVRADLPEANSLSIYRRMQTERERDAKELRAKGAEEAQKIQAIADKERTIILADAEQQAETIKGEGDKQALKIFTEAAGSNPEFYDFYRSLQAYRKTLSKDNTSVVLSPDNEFLHYMDAGGKP